MALLDDKWPAVVVLDLLADRELGALLEAAEYGAVIGAEELVLHRELAAVNHRAQGRLDLADVAPGPLGDERGAESAGPARGELGYDVPYLGHQAFAVRIAS